MLIYFHHHFKSSVISFILTIFSSQKCYYHKFFINFSNFLKIFIKFLLSFVLLGDFFIYWKNCSIVLKSFLFKHIYFSVSCILFIFSKHFPIHFFSFTVRKFFQLLISSKGISMIFKTIGFV